MITRSIRDVAFFMLVTFILIICISHPALADKPGLNISRKNNCNLSIPEVFEKVSPSVVTIKTFSINPYKSSDRIEQSQGTGFIFDSSGLVLTNAHVIYGGQSLFVTLSDGIELPATLIGFDLVYDVAIIKIPVLKDRKYKVVRFADSENAKVGQSVIAIGNPLGLHQSLTAGVISGIDHIIPSVPFTLSEPFLQVDVAINPGNSGGPLLNRCGQVVGINTANVPSAENIGFSIPSNLVIAITPMLLEHGKVMRPWIGFHGQFVDKKLQELVRIPLTSGLLVELVEPDSPADHAGLLGGRFELSFNDNEFLLGGDIITHINGIKVENFYQLVLAIAPLTIDDRIKLVLSRQGKSVEIEYVLTDRPTLPSDLPDSRINL